MTLTPHALTAVHKQALGQAVPSVRAALPVAAARTVRAARRQAGWVQAPGLTGLGSGKD